MAEAMRRLIAAFLLGATLITGAWAQTDAPQAATLVADSLRIEGNGLLIAEGNVEVIYQGVTLFASRVVYDRVADNLRIDGPIRLSDGETALLLASSAELDSTLTDGLLRSARLVLDQQLQLAAAEIVRADARYTELKRVVASSCEVCAGQTPLWEIRASGVVHDQLERQLYFSNAQLRLGGLPIFYIPRLRLPDPTLERATGFLIPRIRTTSKLSTGLKIPYFIRIGDSSDIELTPYVSSATSTLELRYRQAFRTGNLLFEGAYTAEDDILGGASRGFAFLSGGFRLPGEYRLDFDYEYVTDRAYGLDYGYFDKDRLESEISISRTQRDEFLRGGFTFYETLREADIGIEDTLPSQVGEVLWTRRVPTGELGGDAWVTLDGRTLTRDSNADIIGRDVARIGADIEWRRDWIAPQGVLIEARAGLSADAYAVENDSTFDASPSRLNSRAAITLRWPLLREIENGSRQLLEPIAQFVWTESSGDQVPNEDSILVEFDEGNLFGFSRYPGVDRIETGPRANVGVNWRHVSPTGLTIGVTAGRVIRFDDTDQFASGTGLEGDLSNWLAAVQVRQTSQFSLINRSLFDDRLEFTRNETRLDWLATWGILSTSYIWAVPVPSEDRPDRLSEWAFEADYGFNRNWRGLAFWRYDFVADRAARAGLGVTYTNECINLDVALSRRFTSSTSVTPTTDLGISVSLNGFGTGEDGTRYRRACSG